MEGKIQVNNNIKKILDNYVILWQEDTIIKLIRIHIMDEKIDNR